MAFHLASSFTKFRILDTVKDQPAKHLNTRVLSQNDKTHITNKLLRSRDPVKCKLLLEKTTTGYKQISVPQTWLPSAKDSNSVDYFYLGAVDLVNRLFLNKKFLFHNSLDLAVTGAFYTELSLFIFLFFLSSGP